MTNPQSVLWHRATNRSRSLILIGRFLAQVSQIALEDMEDIVEESN